MPRPDNPYAPCRPGEDLIEVLQRLDLMERKLDWIARRVAALARVECCMRIPDQLFYRDFPVHFCVWNN